MVDVEPTTDPELELETTDDGTTWVGWNSADFRREPMNASLDGHPTDRLVVSNVSRRLPLAAGAVRVTAKWGYGSTPASVEQATLLQASRLFVRRVSPFGVAGSPDMGSELRLLAALDPDVQALLRPYRLWWV